MGLKGSKKLGRKLRRMKSDLRREPAKAASRSFRTMTETSAKSNIVENDTVASTTLFRSFNTTINPGPVGVKTRVRFVNNAPHAAFVEFGTGGFHRPNPYTDRFSAPPLTARLIMNIKAWIIMKPSFVLYTDINTASIAIATVIARGDGEGRPPGTEAQPFFVPAWKGTKAGVKRSIRYAVRRSV